MLLTYTSYAEVRAVIGVSATELPDTVLSQPMYDTHLLNALEDVAVGIPALFIAISALSASAATADQTRFLGLVSLFAPYAIAKQLLTSLPMFGIQSLTDGRAGFTRLSDSAIYDDVRDSVNLVLTDIKLRLAVVYYRVTSLTATASVTIKPVFSLSAGILTDPVTGV